MDTIPSRKKCFELMEHYNMLPNIRAHSEMVCRVALCLAKALNQKGEHLNLKAIEAGSLLHDITKSQSIITRENHAKTGAELLYHLGYKRVAAIVREHTLSLHPKKTNITESEIVNYADKRVMHDRIVGLSDRFRDLQERYGKDTEARRRIEKLKSATTLIEKKISRRLGVSPDELINYFRRLTLAKD